MSEHGSPILGGHGPADDGARPALPAEAERFLARLERALAGLPSAERREVVEEIRSHLADRAAQGAADPLAGFGDPEAYAAGFVQERALAGALARGGSWGVGRALLAGARRLGWWYLVLVLGLVQLYGALFLALAALKPLFPAHVGLFIGPGHFSLGATIGTDLAGTSERLGWWSIPIFTTLGVALAWGGSWTLRALGRWRLARLRAAGGRRA